MEDKNIQNYLDMDEQAQEALTDHEYLEKMMRLEKSLHSSLKNKPIFQAEDMQVAEKTLVSLAEEFVEGGFQTFQKNHTNTWKKILSNEADFSCFQDMVSYIAAQDEEPLKTPAYLKHIVEKRLASPDEKKQNILIQLKDSLKLLASNVENLFEIPVLQDAVATRSAGAVDSDTQGGLLQFYTQEEDDQRIAFQVVKDSPQTLTLSMKLCEAKAEPMSITLKKDGRMLKSNSSDTGYFQFNRLHQGEYDIQIKDGQGEVYKSFDIQILE